MARYKNKAQTHLDTPDPTAQAVNITTEKDRRLSNWRLSCVGGWEASKGKESGKGEEQVKDNPVSEGDWKHPILLWYLSEEGPTEADQEGEGQEVDK